MLTFSPYNLRGRTLKNRIVLPPMCMIQSDDSGQANDFHFVHYGTRSIGGAGLIITEATAVESGGRITNKDLGLWSDRQIEGQKRIVEAIHLGGAVAGIQISHAGRKSAVVNNSNLVAPSAISYNDNYEVPKALSTDDIKQSIAKFCSAAKRAVTAGFDLLEIHAAHGYLIHQFLSPLSNRRSDQYGGSIDNRMRFLSQIIAEVRQVIPKDRLLAVRFSASDNHLQGLTLDDTLYFVERLKKKVDLFDISTGGILPQTADEAPGYLTDYAKTIREQCAVPVITVGMLTTLAQVEDVLKEGKADLVALGRELLRNPYWPLRHWPTENGLTHIPDPYRRSFE